MGRSRSIPEDFGCPKPTGGTSQPSLSQLFPTTWEQEAGQEMEEADQEMEEADQLKEAKQEK